VSGGEYIGNTIGQVHNLNSKYALDGNLIEKQTKKNASE
jgi:hypothetical protein